jgi:DNA-binding CsgD family transcriptional regulator
MAEAARALAAQPLLRVCVRAGLRESLLKHLVLSLGHELSEAARADVVLGDGDAEISDETVAVVLGGRNSSAGGQLAEDASPEQIDAALRAVAAGLVVRGASRYFDAEEPVPAPLLTPREIEILAALSDGLSNKAIARRLEISQHTVKFHAESIFRKLGATNRAEAVARGLRRGLVHL